jgi:WW domain-binding protein 4
LGFTDPDTEKLELRKQQGLVGDWQIVQPLPPPAPQEGEEEQDAKHGAVADADRDQDTSAKRPAEVPPDDSRSFKLRKKTASAGLGELYDPGLIPIELKKKKGEIPTEPEVTPIPTPSTSEIPKWTSISLKPKEPSSSTSAPTSSPSPSTTLTQKAGENTEKHPTPSRWAKIEWNQPLREEEVSSTASLPQEPPPGGNDSVKTEEGNPVIKFEPNGSSLVSEPEQPATSLFKKRKSGSGRGRRQL